MDVFFSIIFKIILALFVFIVIYKMFVYIVVNKLMGRILSASDEEKRKVIRIYSRIMPIYKILFWMAPLYLLVLPISVYLFDRGSFVYFAIIMVLMYLVVLEDYFYRRRMLKLIVLESEKK